MKRLLINSIIFSLLFLTSCQSPFGGTPAPTSISTPDKSPSPTPTASPAPTATPEPSLSQDTQAIFDKAGIKWKDLGTVKIDGLHITLESGEVVISLEDLNKNSYLGQNNVWQYRNTENTQVLYAFDKENNTFLEASEYVQLDKMNVEGYIHVDNMDELNNLVRITEMLSMPFPENTYFPPSDKINLDWDNRNSPNFGNPFGALPKYMHPPFRIANHVFIGADPENGRPLVSLSLLQHVYNPDDGSFSTIVYVRDFPGSEKDRLTLIAMIQDRSTNSNPNFILPYLSVPANDLNHPSLTTVREFYKNGSIKRLVSEWINTGHVPYELTQTPVNFIRKVFR